MLRRAETRNIGTGCSWPEATIWPLATRAFALTEPAGDFMRRLRPATQIEGLPAVLVAAHPVKNAADDNLVPYGSGARSEERK